MSRSTLIKSMLTAAVLSFSTGVSFAVTDYSEEFSATAQDWRSSDGVTPLTWVSGGGPLGAGDAYVSATNLSLVGTSTGQLVIAARGHDAFNSSADAFVGDWLGSGVALFTVSLRHDLGTPAHVGVRFASPFNFPGAVVESSEPVPSGEWVTLVVPVASNNTGFTSFEGSSFTNVFANIGNVQVFLSVPEGLEGTAGPYTVDIDRPAMNLVGVEPEDASAAAPDYDRWMYPFNASAPPGSRPTASTWGALGDDSADFDERDAQAYFAFILTNEIPAGLGPSSYEIVSCRFTATASDGTFAYDPTQDDWTTLLADTQAMYQVDADAGRPMELFGAGYRDIYSAWNYAEDGSWAPTGVMFVYKGVRSVYPLGLVDGETGDVSNSVNPDGTGTNGYNPGVFAVGTTAATPGDAVAVPAEFAFDVNVGEAWIQAYLQAALDDGILPFVLTSLHPAEQGGPLTYPVWDQKESVVGSPATLEIAYYIRPMIEIEEYGGLRVAKWHLGGSGAFVEAAASLTNQYWIPVTSIVRTNGTHGYTTVDSEEEGWYLRLNTP